MAGQHVVVIDEGTTSTRTVLFDEESSVVAEKQLPISIHAPSPFVVEQDAAQMWDRTLTTLRDVLSTADAKGRTVSALGLSNQRTTTVLWDRSTGLPAAPIVNWQDTRCEPVVRRMRADWATRMKTATGQPLQAANIALHLHVLLQDPALRQRAEAGDLLAGTPDTWIIWHLTGGPGGGRHVTSYSNAGSTGVFDFRAMTWWNELLDELDVPLCLLPEIQPDDGDFGTASAELLGRALPIRSAFADQQAALFGHGGFETGAAKCTHGTGSFVDFNIGSDGEPVEGLDLRVAWRTQDGMVRFMYEGSSYVTGSAVDWLVNDLGVLEAASELDAVCARTPTGNGVILIPALAGFTAPHWDQSSRGSIFGLHRGTTRDHLVRATVDGVAATVADFIRFMADSAGTAPGQINADGGLARSDALLQSQADLTEVTVRRAADPEYVTARGAAWMAGVATGVWPSKEEAASAIRSAGDFAPGRGDEDLANFRSAWDDAVKRTLGWHHQPLNWRNEA